MAVKQQKDKENRRVMQEALNSGKEVVFPVHAAITIRGRKN